MKKSNEPQNNPAKTIGRARRPTTSAPKRLPRISKANTPAVDGKSTRERQPQSEAERRYRLLADNATDIIWTMENKDGLWRFTYLSPSVTRVLGFTVDEAMRIDPARGITRASWESAKRIDKERLTKEDAGDRTSGTPLTIEVEIYRKDGSTTWAETAVTPLLDAEGRTVGLLGVTRDVSERKKAEEKLQELYRQEKALRQQIENEMNRRIEFTRALAHELKTPLTPVLASIDSLLAEMQDERLLSLARNIGRGANNLNSRIDELLDLARGEVGILQLNPEYVDPLPLLREVGESVAPVAASRGQSLVLDLPCSLSMVRADVSRVHQILLNLLENAVKFTPKNGKISLKAKERDGFLVVEVQDTGRGMSRDEQKRVFEPYHRRVGDRSRFSGLGIGLALCKTLVELHGGQIWMRSRVGKGSTFAFSLPLEGATRDSGVSDTATKLWKILIIEDDQEIVDSISLAFDKDWPEVKLVSTGMGEEGIDLVETEAPDIVILDLGLPDLDGLDVLKSIRLFSSVPVVVLTVRGEERDVIRGLNCGANDYIAKPFRKSELLARLKAQLRKQTPEDQEAPVVCGPLRLDPSTRQLTYGTREIGLTAIEGRLLEHLMRNAGQVTTYSRLTEAVWGEDHPGAIDSLRVYIGYLRAKLEMDARKPKIIRTRAGVGYSLIKPL
jgi:PAS domain S-box-containing protein